MARLPRVRRTASPAVRELAAPSDCERLSARPPGRPSGRSASITTSSHLRDELRAGPQPTVAEGADLLPELLDQANIPLDRAVWVVPTPEFQLHHYGRRPWAYAYVVACPDPAAASTNWLRRDTLFANHVAAQATRLGGGSLLVDGSRSADDLAAEVARHFGIPVQ